MLTNRFETKNLNESEILSALTEIFQKKKDRVVYHIVLAQDFFSKLNFPLTEDIMNFPKRFSKKQNLLTLAATLGSGLLGEVLRLTPKDLLDKAVKEPSKDGNNVLAELFNKRNSDDEVIALLTKASKEAINEAALTTFGFPNLIRYKLNVMDLMIVQKRSQKIIDVFMDILSEETQTKILEQTSFYSIAIPTEALQTNMPLKFITSISYHAVCGLLSNEHSFNKDVNHLVSKIKPEVLSKTKSFLLQEIFTFNPSLLNQIVKDYASVDIPVLKDRSYLYQKLDPEVLALTLAHEPEISHQHFSDHHEEIPDKIADTIYENDKHVIELMACYEMLRNSFLPNDLALLVIIYMSNNIYLAEQTMDKIKMFAENKREHKKPLMIADDCLELIKKEEPPLKIFQDDAEGKSRRRDLQLFKKQLVKEKKEDKQEFEDESDEKDKKILKVSRYGNT